MQFHKAIIRMGGVALMASLAENLFIHMRAVRAVTMTQDNRAQRSIVDHREIIAALAAHDADAAERLVREHTLGLAAHVEKFGDFLDAAMPTDEEGDDDDTNVCDERSEASRRESGSPGSAIPRRSAPRNDRTN